MHRPIATYPRRRSGTTTERFDGGLRTKAVGAFRVCFCSVAFIQAKEYKEIKMLNPFEKSCTMFQGGALVLKHERRDEQLWP